MLSLQNIPLKIDQTIKQTKKVSKRTKWKKSKSSNPPIFITKTYKILQNDIYNEIICWNEEGINFIINNIERFQQQVLPIHFRHRNFSSFVRQLNMYDFHKIRNDNNVSIFEHKQFKKYHKECLKNIKRKGCNIKKNEINEQNLSISQHEELIYGNQETDKYQGIDINEYKYQMTIQSIGKIQNQYQIDSLRIIESQINPFPYKKLKMQQFMSSLLEIIYSQKQIYQIIKQLKNDPYYKCLNNKRDICKIIQKIKRKNNKNNKNLCNDDDLQQLSIEVEILAEKINHNNQDVQQNLSLEILSTQKYLPKSIYFINSMNLCDNLGQLFYQKLY